MVDPYGEQKKYAASHISWPCLLARKFQIWNFQINNHTYRIRLICFAHEDFFLVLVHGSFFLSQWVDKYQSFDIIYISGYNSMVECHPSKLDVACSNHVTRSKHHSTSSVGELPCSRSSPLVQWFGCTPGGTCLVFWSSEKVLDRGLNLWYCMYIWRA